METFRDQGVYLHAFTDRIDVHCPKCKSSGVIHSEARQRESASFSCGACGFHVRQGLAWFRPWEASYEGRCESCRSRLRADEKGSAGKIPKQRFLHCKLCETNVVGSLVYWQGERGTCDPYFGMDLFLVRDFGRETLWAYNRDHLRFLKSFVHADQRQRTANHNSSLVSRLPRWMKLAKNRDALLRAIEGLEKAFDDEHGGHP